MFYKVALKRAGDIAGAVIGLILMSPLLLVLSVLIFAHDRGPIFFKQKRIGLNGKEFWFIKFRSMPVNTPNVTSTETAKLAITPIGKFIRRTNIDELPQLLNVLKGEMSIIGPRPCIPTQTTLIQARQENNALSIRPGLTGWAQVNAYDHMPDTEKAALDGYYAQHISLVLDLRIVLKTAVYFTRKPPVY